MESQMLTVKDIFGLFRALTLIVVGVALASAPLPGDEGPGGQPTTPDVSITGELAAVNAAMKQQDFATVWQRCHTIVQTASMQPAEALSGPEHYAVGLAHYYLAAEAFDKAIQIGGLAPDDAQSGQALYAQIMTPPDILVVGRGQRVDIEEHLAEGKTTIVDFYSKYCVPCLALSQLLGELAAKRPDIRVVKVDINRPGVEGIDWGSPTAQQFAIHSLPYFKIFDAQRQLSTEGEEALNLILSWTGLED